MDDELQAIHQLKRGKTDGLEILISHYQSRCLRVAFLITHDQAMAEDAVQDAFIRIYQRIHQFDETRPFEPYLLRSVVNAALNLTRNNIKKNSLDKNLEKLESLLATAASVESSVEDAQTTSEILVVMALLSPRQRAVVVQRYFLEMNEKEMATALNAAPGTVKWLLNAARKRLRSLLEAGRSVE